jgi:hypothetical protein
VLRFGKYRVPDTPSIGGLADGHEQKNLRPSPGLNAGPPDTLLIELSRLV